MANFFVAAKIFLLSNQIDFSNNNSVSNNIRESESESERERERVFIVLR